MKYWYAAALVASLFVFGVPPSQASVVGYTGYAVDTSTGLQWLDVSTTFDQSYNAVSAELSNPNSSLYGYRYATVSDLTTLLEDAGIAQNDTSNGYYCDPCGTGTSYANFVNLLGPSVTTVNSGTDTEHYIQGITGTYNSNVGGGEYALSYLLYTQPLSGGDLLESWAIPAWNNVTPSSFENNVGSLLVKTSVTPLPSALLLFTSGLAVFGIVGWGDKKRKSKRQAMPLALA